MATPTPPPPLRAPGEKRSRSSDGDSENNTPRQQQQHHPPERPKATGACPAYNHDVTATWHRSISILHSGPSNSNTSTGPSNTSISPTPPDTVTPWTGDLEVLLLQSSFCVLSSPQQFTAF